MLEAVGVSASDEAVYRALLRAPRSTAGDLAGRLRRDVGSVRRAVHRLEQLGLVTRLPAAGSAGDTGARAVRLLASRPDVAVDVLVARRQEELTRTREAARALLAEQVTDDERRPDQLIEVVHGREAVATRFAQLLAGTVRELDVFDRPPYAAAHDNAEPVVRGKLRRGVSVRGVYAPESLERPGALAEARDAARLGERSRLHPSVPMKLAICDSRVALLPLASGEAVDGALVVHPCALLDALRALFELLWQQAVPVFEAGGGPSAEHGTLLTALAAGLKDDAVARQLGTSTRTVRRRIVELTETLHARTRFQAGVLAERRGLLDLRRDTAPPVAE